jgi:hypothetical protein
MSNMKFGILALVACGLMGLLSAAVFCVSYDSLLSLAISAGVSPGVAWMWPLSLDGLMILTAVVRLRYSLEGKPHRVALYVLGAATLASIGLNVAHAPGNVVSQIVFGIPPLVLFISSELALGMVEDVVKTKAKVTAAKKRAAAKKATKA